jgi:lipid-binding SYLF domain-containing protein
MKSVSLQRFLVILAFTFAAACLAAHQAAAVAIASAAELDTNSRAALYKLYHANPKAQKLGADSEAVLVFPSIYKAGFLVGTHRGEGALLTRHSTLGYYKTTAGSFGVQAGVQRFGYALFFTDKSALAHLHEHGGWELASSPNIVLFNKGATASLHTTQTKGNIYAMFFDERGIMAGLDLQGSRITEIHPK